MKQIIYISVSAHPMSEDELVDILQAARKKNASMDITGVLLYSGGTFIQVLEGPGAHVNRVFESIEKDLRHKNIIKLVDKVESKRNFGDWTMGFATANPEKTEELIGYIRSIDHLLDNDLNNSASLMIRIFITTNNLVISY